MEIVTHFIFNYLIKMSMAIDSTQYTIFLLKNHTIHVGMTNYQIQTIWILQNTGYQLETL